MYKESKINVTRKDRAGFMSRLLFCMIAVSAGLALCSCGEEEAPEVPVERTTLMMDILTDMDMGKYAAALPKIRRYQTVDDTNPFLNELEAIAVTNDCVSRLRVLLDRKDYAGAEQLMEQLLKQYDARTDRVELREFAAKLKHADGLIRQLAKRIPPREMAEKADALALLVKDVPGAEALVLYADRKKADAAELEKLVKDRRTVWLWMDAGDAAANGDMAQVKTLAALIAAVSPEEEKPVRDLMNAGMFHVPEPNLTEVVKE